MVGLISVIRHTPVRVSAFQIQLDVVIYYYQVLLLLTITERLFKKTEPSGTNITSSR